MEFDEQTNGHFDLDAWLEEDLEALVTYNGLTTYHYCRKLTDEEQIAHEKKRARLPVNKRGIPDQMLLQQLWGELYDISIKRAEVEDAGGKRHDWPIDKVPFEVRWFVGLENLNRAKIVDEEQRKNF